MKYRFYAFGHRNISARHKNTLEFTKDKELSEKGDCIVGVGCTWSEVKIKELVRGFSRLKIGFGKQEICCAVNKSFSDKNEIVLRRGDFDSKRTLGIRADKAAIDIDRKMVDKLKRGGRVEVVMEPQIKAVIFDYDDTLIDFAGAKKDARIAVAKRLFTDHGVYEGTTLELMPALDRVFCEMGVGKGSWYYDRHLWMETLLDYLDIPASRKLVKELHSTYWDAAMQKKRGMRGVTGVLKYLGDRVKVVLMTDTDGTRPMKIKRIKRDGLYGLFDYIITSEDTKINKPTKVFYDRIFAKLGVRADECIMVGDKPEVDLCLAKEIGMKTVWMKHGDWAAREGKKHFKYIDHEVKDMDGLLLLMKEMI